MQRETDPFGAGVWAVSEHTVIDFEKAERSGLFLITDRRAAAKRRCLDAMSIALFYKSTAGGARFKICAAFRRRQRPHRGRLSFCARRRRILLPPRAVPPQKARQRQFYHRGRKRVQAPHGRRLGACRFGWRAMALRGNLLSLTAEHFAGHRAAAGANSLRSFCARIPPKKQPF